MVIKSINPSNNKLLGKVQVSSEHEIKAKINLAHRVKYDWKNKSIKDRIKLLKQVKTLLKNNADKIADIITQEVGTPITECRDEIEWDWGYFDWFLENAEKILNPELTYQDEKSIHEIWYEPLGVVAVVTPWNLPFDMFVWGVIPNLLAGNVVVYKASEECILSGKLFADLVRRTDLPKGVFQSIHGDERQGKFLVNQDIDMIWFTGSYEVGHELYRKAADKFIKPVLELGGSNPSIIFGDANVDSLADSLMFKRYSFCGQTCDALKRLIVHKSIFEKISTKLSSKIDGLKVGDPMEPETDMGPLVSHKQLELLQGQFDDAISKGAKVIAQGKITTGEKKGAYFPPTLIGNITTDMRIWKEEVFGPLLPIISFSTEQEAINLANDTAYGLGSQIFTQDKNSATRVAQQIEAGNVDINGVGHFKPCNPFGGYKKSGIGREHGKVGFHELCNIKVVSRGK